MMGGAAHTHGIQARPRPAPPAERRRQDVRLHDVDETSSSQPEALVEGCALPVGEFDAQAPAIDPGAQRLEQHLILVEGLLQPTEPKTGRSLKELPGHRSA
jgi:hypothetical protein